MHNDSVGILLIFVDGVGVGSREPAVNPFARVSTPTILGRFADEIDGVVRVGADRPVWFRAVDATLDVPGLPQSATGQAALLTGFNVPAALGEHRSGVPGPQVRRIIEERSLFRSLNECGKTTTFANAYTQQFFTAPRPRLSASTVAALAGGVSLRTVDDLAAGRAVFHDWTSGLLRSRGHDLPLRTAAAAASTLAALAAEHDFTLYEHFLTDLAGHRGTEEDRLAAAAGIEELLAETAAAVHGTDTLLLAVSDHGNLEDGTTSRHTLAPVPLIGCGPGAQELLARVSRLDELAPAILDSL